MYALYKILYFTVYQIQKVEVVVNLFYKWFNLFKHKATEVKETAFEKNNIIFGI